LYRVSLCSPTGYSHDNIRDPKWIFMEYTPTVVFSALKRNPKSIDKYNKKYDTLNVPQKWEVM
jgi:hypothetical protein